MSDQTALYQQVILAHNRQPKNFSKLEDCLEAEGFNPMCGDHLWVYVKLKDDLINEITFQGSGCAISKASASMMTEAMKGKTFEDARTLCANFKRLLQGEQNLDVGKLKIFSGIWKFPARVKCAGLAWHTFLGVFEKQGQTISTEGSHATL